MGRSSDKTDEDIDVHAPTVVPAGSDPDEADEPIDPDGVPETVVSVKGGRRRRETRDARSTRDTRDARDSGETIGRYTIREKIGSGGMAVVYSAWDPQLSRQVAVKVLQRRLAGRMGQRLVREAQSMAQLSHPNVVTIFEVGVESDEIFICMELVAGANLREWLREKKRSRQEILRTFVAAGRGLDAAHRARIVHRDFKPDNVLIDGEGRVRVTDFGLAREMSEPYTSAPELRDLANPVMTNQPLTMSGDVMGTPVYMAPELLDGETAHARSDQYAFCVALYEALYGVPPYSGRTFAELLSKVSEGKYDPVPENRKIPRWLRAVLLRGMDRTPSRRFKTMSDLIAELERDRGALVRRVAGGGIVATAAALSVVFWMQREPAARPACADATTMLAGVWDLGRRSNVERAFTATRLPHAATSLRTAVGMLDAYATKWTAMNLDSCEASMVRKEQTPELYQMRSLCLERRKTELSAAVSLLEKPDPQVIGRIDEVIGSIESVDQCANAAALLEVIAPPTDPASATQISQIEATLSEATLQVELGKYERAHELVTKARALVGSLDYAPLRARMAVVQGMVETKRGRFVEAEQYLLAAISAAERGRDDRRKVHAYTELQHLVGWEQQDFRRAEGFVELAEAALDRVGDDRELRAEMLKNAAAVAHAAGNFGLALERTREAFRLSELIYGPNHPKVAKLHNQVAVGLTALGRPEEAADHHLKALEQLKATYGETHPDYAITLNDFANGLAQTGKLAEAEEALRRSLEVMVTTFGKRHPQTATAISNVASVVYMRGDPKAALILFREAAAIEEETLGPEHTALATTLVNLGAVELSVGDARQAEVTFRRALEIRERQLPKDDPRIAEVQVQLGARLVDLKRFSDARTLLERAVLTLRDRTSSANAEAHFTLARALWELGIERARARELATTAEQLQNALGDQSAAAAIKTWLAAR